MVWAAGHSLQNGKYTIQDVLGQGGFGITYKALHIRLNAFVVIKTPNEYLKYDPDYDKYVDRFVKEGQRLAQLSQDPHPHIVRVWDLFEEGEIPCMVMDFVPGENLFQLVRRRGALPEAEIVPCIRQIGEALSMIHQASLVHRDAHPGNIIVRPSARAILIDFGIAKELIPSTQSSTSEAGNRGFAPYEQISRGSREPTVDIYCLAATLYFAVTGERPITSLDRRLHDAVLIAPKRLKPDLSEHLNQAVLRGMALEAKDRPQSMRSWLNLLQEPIVQLPGSTKNDNYQRPAEQNQKTSVEPTKGAPGKRSRTVPWGSLAFVLAGYTTTGALLGAYLFTLKTIIAVLVLVVVLATLGTWAVAVIWVVAVLGAITVAVLGAVAGAGDSGVAWGVVVALALGVVVALALALAGGKLLESFSRSHTFLILNGTSLAGLGLGWLIGTLLRSSFPQIFGML